jgi:hypothetical protein
MLAGISPEIGFLDLGETLHARAASGELVYLLDDTHWTPAGHAAVARALHTYLAAREEARAPAASGPAAARRGPGGR